MRLTWDTRYIIAHGISRPSKHCQQFFALAWKFNTENWFSQRTLLLRRETSPVQPALLHASLPKLVQMNRHTKQNGRPYCCVILIVYVQLTRGRGLETHDLKTGRKYIHIHSSCFSVRHCFLESSQASSVTASGMSNMQMKMGMEQ